MKLFTTKPSGGNALVAFRHKRLALWRRFEWIHARRGGGPVLRGESSWRTVCGFLIQGTTWHLIVQFRRFWRHT
jgi:hypothetical protein